MIKNFTTYKQLETERQRLKHQLQFQKKLIQSDFEEIKQELKPVGEVFSFVGNLTTKDKKNPLFVAGIDILIDLILRRIILSRAGLITRLAVPFFVKNYSSHLFTDDKQGLFEKIKNLFKKKKPAEEQHNGVTQQQKP